MLNALLHTAAAWPVPVVLLVASAVLVVESGSLVGIALPGSTLLVALGLWSLATPHALVPAVVASAAATVAGAHLGWWRGRTGPAVGPLPGPVRRLAAPLAARASTWLAQRRGPATAVLLACGHWAAAARPVLPRVAGAAGVPYRIAGPVLVVSGSAWAAALVLLGNRLGALVLTSAAWGPVGVVGVVIGVLVLQSRRARHRLPAPSDGQPPAPDEAALVSTLVLRAREVGGGYDAGKGRRHPPAAPAAESTSAAQRARSPVRGTRITRAEPTRWSEWSCCRNEGWSSCGSRPASCSRPRPRS